MAMYLAPLAPVPNGAQGGRPPCDASQFSLPFHKSRRAVRERFGLSPDTGRQ